MEGSQAGAGGAGAEVPATVAGKVDTAEGEVVVEEEEV